MRYRLPVAGGSAALSVGWGEVLLLLAVSSGGTAHQHSDAATLNHSAAIHLMEQALATLSWILCILFSHAFVADVSFCTKFVRQADGQCPNGEQMAF